jgi:hypothetical protein
MNLSPYPGRSGPRRLPPDPRPSAKTNSREWTLCDIPDTARVLRARRAQTIDDGLQPRPRIMTNFSSQQGDRFKIRSRHLLQAMVTGSLPAPNNMVTGSLLTLPICFQINAIQRSDRPSDSLGRAKAPTNTRVQNQMMKEEIGGKGITWSLTGPAALPETRVLSDIAVFNPTDRPGKRLRRGGSRRITSFDGSQGLRLGTVGVH